MSTPNPVQDPALPKFEVPLNDKGGSTSKYWYFFFQGLLNSLNAGVSQIIAGTGVTITPPSGTGAVTISATGGGGGVSQIIAGTNVTISPPGGTGAVTINSAGGGGAVQFILSAGWNSSTGPVLLAQTVPQDIQIPYNCTLQNVRIQTQGSAGNCTVTLQTAAFPFVTGTDITGGAPPTISGGTSYDNSTLTGWSKVFTQGAMIRATLTVSTNLTSVKIMLRFA